MEIKKKKSGPPTKIHWSEGALFEVRFFQIHALMIVENNNVKQFFEE
jgi:hypothetical protein